MEPTRRYRSGGHRGRRRPALAHPTGDAAAADRDAVGGAGPPHAHRVRAADRVADSPRLRANRSRGSPAPGHTKVRARWYEVGGEQSLFVFGAAAQKPFGLLADTQKRELLSDSGRTRMADSPLRHSGSSTSTPEFNELFQILIASMPAPSEDEPSYFAHGRISPNAVDMLFTASGFLFAITPWSLANDNQILRMDTPVFGIVGARLSIIGQLGQSPGRADLPAVPRSRRKTATPKQPGPGAFGTEVLSLTFHNATQLPPAMRREAMHNGWPVDSPDAYPPSLLGVTPTGIPRPLVERDVETVAAAAPGPGRLPPQARRDLQGRHLHPGLRGVLRRRRPRGPLLRALRRRPASSMSTSPGSRNATPDCSPDPRNLVPCGMATPCGVR